jgi:hypothetical protein
MNKIIIIVIVILIITLYLISSNTEYFTNDEAVKNIASVYNQANMTVTNFNATGNANFNTTNTTGMAIFKGNAGGGTHLPYTDGNNYITSNNNILRGGPTTIQGDLNVSGVSTLPNLNAPNVNAGNINIAGDVMTGKGRVHLTGPEILFLLNKSGVIIGKEWGGNGNLQVEGTINPMGGTQSIVLDAPSWDQAAFISLMKPYFNASMADGTTINFVFVYPNRSAGNVNVRYATGVKLGRQYYLINGAPDHNGVTNPWSNGSQDLSWRGNI